MDSITPMQCDIYYQVYILELINRDLSANIAKLDKRFNIAQLWNAVFDIKIVS